MDPQFNLNHFIFLLITIHFPGFLCQKDLDYSNCGYFQCATREMITYPFWDAATVPPGKLSLCGHPSFGLNCSGDDPILKISGVPYRITKFDFFDYIIIVSRQDQYGLDPCNPLPLNTTLSSPLFSVVPNFEYENITLYYNCIDQMPGLPNQFICDSNMNFFQLGNHVLNNFTCEREITVPVSEPAAGKIKTAADLFSAGRRGSLGSFAIKWSADNWVCEECHRIGWTCVYSYQEPPTTTLSMNSGGFHCYRGRTKKRDGFNPVGLPGGETQSPSHSPPYPANDSKNSSLTPKNSSMGSNHRWTKLGLGFGGIVIVLVFVLVSWRYKVRCLHGDPMNKNVEMFLAEHGSLYPKRYKYSHIKKITNSFTDKLGQGGFGSVYRGTLPNGSLVAVKVLNKVDSNDEEFINEVASIGRTSHVNIVGLLGFCYERKKRALVYEFMPNNSLDKFIPDADTGKLFDIAVGVAKGLEYLHRGCNTGIIHFDIKPQNILLDEDFCPKISDFGLAKLCKKKESILSVLGMRGTVGYIAPEVFSRNFGKVSHKSDVYSYGIMVLEMAGAKQFVEAETIPCSENYFPDKIYKDVMEFGRVNTDEGCYEPLVHQEDERVRKMFLIGFWCIQTIPSNRPSMSNVVEMLEGNLESIQIPPKPLLFNPTLMGQRFSSELSIRVDIEHSTEEESLLSS